MISTDFKLEKKPMAVFTLQVLKQIFRTSWALPRCVNLSVFVPSSSCESSPKLNTRTEQKSMTFLMHTHTSAETQQETVRVCQDGKLEEPFFRTKTT